MPRFHETLNIFKHICEAVISLLSCKGLTVALYYVLNIQFLAVCGSTMQTPFYSHW